MYAFGMCCLLAFVPNAPPTVDPFTLVHKIPTSVKKLEPELHSLLEVTLCQDPKRRATASELLEHEFFKVDAVVHELEERKRKAEEDANVIARKCAEGRPGDGVGGREAVRVVRAYGRVGLTQARGNT